MNTGRAMADKPHVCAAFALTVTIRGLKSLKVRRQGVLAL
jgi:hypothetical protein